MPQVQFPLIISLLVFPLVISFDRTSPTCGEVISCHFTETGACIFQLPRMLETDAVARYYGLGKGTVVKVIYDSELTGNHVTYRCIF